MHELGVLMEAVKTVNKIATQNKIERVKHITLEVGEESSYVPMYFMKLFPLAIDGFSVLESAELKIVMAHGKGLQIKDIGY
ncbi:MAG: hydrogenase maturation nickel metallochaperone HypA [Firmicutes bacterium]|nr:hydrogenase maturation nickel metallochaperone HypA [Bacillota bacterium]